MQQTIHFISGLPRSGSTLLAALLRQSPTFRASVQTPLADLVASTVRLLSVHESAMFVSNEQRHRVVEAIVTAYYREDRAANPAVVFDSNRAWAALLPTIATVFPGSRLICCVRNPAWIVDSMERLVQRNPLLSPRIFSETGNVYTRAEAFSKHTLGNAIAGFKQAWCSEYADRLIVLRYDSLAAKPRQVMSQLYRLLSCTEPVHDFSHVEYDEPEFDARLGLPGLHRVSGPVEFRTRATILPAELFRQHDNEFWSGVSNNPRNVTVL